MKIVVLDGYTENPGDLSWEWLNKYGDAVIYERTLTEEETIERIADAEVVFTNKCAITENVMDNCKNIRLISVLATGYNIVDTDYARKNGIDVCNVPSYGTATVAQFAIGLLLEICNNIGMHDRLVHDGKWESCPDFCFWAKPQIELDHKTIGIIGFGRIGRQTGKIASALGMNVLAYGSHETEDGKKIGKYVDLDTLLRQSDVISLHCPLKAENRELICQETISKMKDGVIIINNSRGQLINEKDLAYALNSGKVAYAAVDVVSKEPIEHDNPLLSAKNCIITPHISWAAKEARQRIMQCSEANLKAFINGKTENLVN